MAAVLLCLAGGPATTVLACGYHDPASIRVGVLNWVYPNSLHVNGAIWAAQRAGELTGTDLQRMQARGVQRRFLDSVAYSRSAAALRGLGEWMGATLPPGRVERFSMVLVETGMWTRFSIGPAERSVEVDVSGPGETELVMVTGEAVLHAMRGGELTLADAIKSGMLRLYRSRVYVEPRDPDDFVQTYAMAGAEPLPKVSMAFSAQSLVGAGHAKFSSKSDSAISGE